jgi:hypothetical protein
LTHTEKNVRKLLYCFLTFSLYIAVYLLRL